MQNKNPLTKEYAEGAAVELLEVGYGRVDVTPGYPVPIAGSAASRISEGVEDPLYITFLALRQGQQTLLLATMDFVGSYAEYAQPLREAVSLATSIPEEFVILNSTHTHSSAAIRNEEGLNIEKYREEVTRCAIAAAEEALEDLSPTEVWYGSTQAKGMAWVRHYKMADGTYAGANYGSFKKSTIVGHASEADTQMQLVKFARSSWGKKDIVLMNFPAHGTLHKNLLLSADFPGPARAYVAEKTGALVAYFIAGAGDQVPSSRVPEEMFSDDYKVYGKELGRIAVEGLQSLRKLDSTELRFCHRTFTGKANQEGLDRLEDAQAVKAIWNQVGGRGTPEGKAAAKDHGFSSVYQVTAILNRVHLGPTRSLELRTLAIGDLAMILAPYEMFGASAMYIKEHSPYAMTFVISCSQNHDGYLPSQLGWQLQCYESQITRFARGTAEQLAQEYVDILTEMKGCK